MREDARIHNDNMAQARAALDANQQNFAAQQAQAAQGLQMQQAAMQEQKAQADRQMAINQASLERSINAGTDKPQATFKSSDAGMAGTILTNPLGVKKDEIKKGTKLLGGV